MDRPIDLTKLRPTRPPDSSASTHPSAQHFMVILRQQARALLRHPYDPNSWIGRATTLGSLGFPELAVGDTHKATRLCQTMLSFLDSHRGEHWSLGYGKGFWMRQESDSETTEEQSSTKPRQLEALTALIGQAYTLQSSNLHYQDHNEGRYVPQAYPWLEQKHRVRGESVLADINLEIKSIGKTLLSGNSYVQVRRCSFLTGAEAPEESVSAALGMFANCNLKAGSKIMVDKTNFFGCIGPGSNDNTSNLNGGRGCPNPMHPNLEHDEAKHNLRWIRDRTGRHAADTVLLCRTLLAGIQQGVKNPLDLPAIARLVPAYHRQNPRTFRLKSDIAITNQALQQFGIDIFANHHYDTWVLFTISSRLHNNSWSNPVVAGLNPLFSLFNHSCDPNVEWKSLNDHRTIEMHVSRDVTAGEQLFVEYDSYVHDQPYRERRARLARWIDGPCLCSRCVREEHEMFQGHNHADMSGSDDSHDERRGGSVLGTPLRPAWDDCQKPTLPEDALWATNGSNFKLRD